MTNVVENVKKIVTPKITELGYEAVDVSYTKQYGQMNLTVYIWKKGGVTLDDCELINNAIEPILDENDITIGESYNLNISSLGLDRPIVSNDDLRRSLDTDIEFLENNSKKSLHGRLLSYTDESLTIALTNKEYTVARNNLIYVRPYISFK